MSLLFSQFMLKSFTDTCVTPLETENDPYCNVRNRNRYKRGNDRLGDIMNTLSFNTSTSAPLLLLSKDINARFTRLLDCTNHSVLSHADRSYESPKNLWCATSSLRKAVLATYDIFLNYGSCSPHKSIPDSHYSAAYSISTSWVSKPKLKRTNRKKPLSKLCGLVPSCSRRKRSIFFSSCIAHSRQANSSVQATGVLSDSHMLTSGGTLQLMRRKRLRSTK